jgi:competence protein ComEC
MAGARLQPRHRPAAAGLPAAGRPLPPFGPGVRWLGLDETLRRLGDAFTAEFAAGAGRLWLVVLFAGGAALYAAAPAEPSVVAVVLLAAALVGLTVWRRRAGHDARLAAALAALALGALIAKLESDRLAAPRLDRERTVTVAGWIADAEATLRDGRRLVVAVKTMEARGLPAEAVPARITVTARGAGRDLAVGAGVTFLARLRPPDGPTLPGGYDFARHAWFEGRGASGFVLGKVTPADLGPPPAAVRWTAPLANLRAAIGKRVRAALPGTDGTVAAALMVGEARAIPASINDSLRISGLYHIISISGLHMTLVAGGVFTALRFALLAVPGYAARHNGKKLAAIFAVAAAGFYLLLSGSGVATVRSFIMFAVALAAVLADRTAVTRATVAVSAAIVVALWPSSVVEPSFLMSFLAVAALVATFEVWQTNRPDKTTEDPRWLRLGRGALLYLAGAALTSLVAGLATAPVVIDAFHRAAPYGVLANLASLPLVGLIIMPMAVVAGLALPFGLEAWPLMVMGWGIEAMVAVSDVVAGLPGGGGLVGRIHPWTAPLAVAGILWLILWRSAPLRLAGLAPILLALALAPLAQRIDVFVADDGKTVAARGADGRLTLTGAKDNAFAAATWLLADADGRPPRDKAVAAGWACDAGGCETATAQGVVVLALDLADLPRDCRRAVVLVTPLVAPRACAETTVLLDRPALRATGSVAIDLAARQIRIAHAARRPWSAGRADPERLPAWPETNEPGAPVYVPPDPTDAVEAEADAAAEEEISRAPP